MSPDNSLHASAYYGEYDEDLIFLCFFWTDREVQIEQSQIS